MKQIASGIINIFTVLVITLSIIVMTISMAAATTPTLTPHPTHPDTIFFDDFTSPVLDRAKWNVRVTGWTVNNEQQAYVDSAVTIYLQRSAAAANGVLVLHPRFCPGFTTREGKKFDLISGRIDSRGKFEFTYGTIATRIKLPVGAGLWPAFWLLGNGRWPDCGEIDIMESVGDSSWTSVALHGPGYFGNTPLSSRTTFALNEDAGNWHIYSVDWLPDSLIFRVDGNSVYSVTRPMVEQYGRWVFDNDKYIILNFALGGTYPNAVNRIDKPYFGLPEITVQLIKEIQVKLLVDWVLVTRTK